MMTGKNYAKNPFATASMGADVNAAVPYPSHWRCALPVFSTRLNGVLFDSASKKSIAVFHVKKECNIQFHFGGIFFLRFLERGAYNIEGEFIQK